MKNFTPSLLCFFQDNNLQCEYHEHPPIFTVEEGEKLKQSLPGLQTKNLFLTDKRGQYRLVCIESSKRLQINQFRKLVGAKDMTFGSPEEMKDLLDLTPGSVSVFGLINTSVSMRNEAIRLFLDKDLREADLVGRHPNRNDATIIISHETLEEYLIILGYDAKILDIKEMKIVNKKPT